MPDVLIMSVGGAEARLNSVAYLLQVQLEKRGIRALTAHASDREFGEIIKGKYAVKVLMWSRKAKVDHFFKHFVEVFDDPSRCVVVPVDWDAVVPGELASVPVLPVTDWDDRGRAGLFQHLVERLVARIEGDEDALSALAHISPADLPQQSSLAVRFDPYGEGPIRAMPEEMPTAAHETADLYEDLKSIAAELLLKCGRRGNRLAFLAGAAQGFLDALSETPATVRPRALWSKGNTLRRLRDGDIRSRASVDPEDPPLPDAVRALVEDLVDHFNLFAGLHPDLAKFDRLSLGPRDRADVLREIDLGARVATAALHEPEVVDGEAKRLLRDAIQAATEARSQVGVNADQALLQTVETQRNLGIALVAKALAEAREVLKSIRDGALKEVGASAVKALPFSSLLHKVQDWIVPLFSKLPGGEAVMQVVRLVGRLIE